MQKLSGGLEVNNGLELNGSPGGRGIVVLGNSGSEVNSGLERDGSLKWNSGLERNENPEKNCECGRIEAKLSSSD